MNKQREIKVVYWNCRNIKSKLEETRAFLQSNDVDVLLLGETHLKPGQSLKIPNYCIYRKDRKIKAGGGVAVLIRKSLIHTCLEDKDYTHLETIGIQVKTKNGPINLYAGYLPPNQELCEEELTDLFANQTKTLLGADLNSKHPSWNSKTHNSKGIKLQRMAYQLNLLIEGPQEVTHIHEPTNTTDVLDIYVMKNINENYNIETIKDLCSDHLPVKLSLEIEPQDEPTGTTINWTTFKQAVAFRDVVIRQEADVHQMAAQIEEDIKDALTVATTIKKPKRNHTINTTIKIKITEKRKIAKTYTRTLHPEDKRKLNQVTNEIKELLRNEYNESWERKLESLNDDENDLWKMAKALRNERTKLPPLKSRSGKTLLDSKSKAEEFATELEETFQPNKSHSIHEKLHRIVEEKEAKKRRATTAHPALPIATKSEIEAIIKNLKVKKAAGIDRIPNQALKHLPVEGLEAICKLTNGILTHRTFPTAWKKAKIVMIHKPGKPKNEATGYRPISLLSTISKIVERVIHTRLQEEVQEKQILPNFQFGFREQHSTCQQIIRLTEHLTGKMNTAIPTAAIFLDIEKAFDRVWHLGLVHKLRQAEINGNLIELIADYLDNRTFQVNIEEETSEPKYARAGVPQGSILGPTLFNLYTADMPDLRYSEIAQYADDTVIYYSNRNLTSCNKRLQEDLDTLDSWYSKWRIKINPTKTTGVFFKHRNRPKKPDELQLDGQRIPWTNNAKYLGVQLDDRLKYDHHVKHVKKKIHALRNQLYPLINYKSKLSIRNKLKIIKMVIIPAATYAGEAWHQTDKTRKKQIQGIINKIIRSACCAPKYITNERLFRN